jgi:hypothetical protein
MGNDVDVFAFAAELPLAFQYTGQRAGLTIEAWDSEGESITSLAVECGFALEPTPCAQFDGSGDAVVTVSLRESDGAEQRELDAWQLSW